MDYEKQLQMEHEEKIMYKKFSESLTRNYQNIYLINSNTATVEIIKQNGRIANRQKDIEVKHYSYERIFKSYISTRVAEEYTAVVSENMRLENIIEQMKHNDSYEFSYRVSTNGNEENYQAQYFDLGDGNFVCCLQNIDLMIEAENKNNNKLHAIIDKMQSMNEELSEYINIISSAGYGIWHIIIKDGAKPRMQVNDKMAELLGIDKDFLTEEEIYASWYDYILPEALPSVQASVQEMMNGNFSENTYKWEHPSKGVIYVRCGGTYLGLPDGTTVLRGYHTEVTDIVKKEQEQREILQNALHLLEIRNNELTKQLSIIDTIAKIFNCIYIFNMKNYTFNELGSEMDSVHDIVGDKKDAREVFSDVSKVIFSSQMQEAGREFLNLETLNDRLKDKRWISRQFYGPVNGWYEAIFIVVNRDENGNCNNVIWATRDINEMKNREEQLLYSSQTDEMTHLFNRRAYEYAIKEYETNGIPDNLVYIAIDVNGLKVVNDTLGHEAGDELIIGASHCLKECFGHYGTLYRTGGDEFVALINTTEKNLEHIKQSINEVTAEWSGNLVKSLAISCGYIARWNAKDLTMHEISVQADQEMYANKALYYQSKGIDRRGQKDAFEGLHLVYDKMLKINITNDSYQILNIGEIETMEDVRNIKTISEWFTKFANSELIHPDDAQMFLEKTNFTYLRNYFNDGKRRMGIKYRKRYANIYKETIAEIILAKDYKKDNEVFYLYVKKIEE